MLGISGSRKEDYCEKRQEEPVRRRGLERWGFNTSSLSSTCLALESPGRHSPGCFWRGLIRVGRGSLMWAALFDGLKSRMNETRKRRKQAENMRSSFCFLTPYAVWELPHAGTAMTTYAVWQLSHAVPAVTTYAVWQLPHAHTAMTTYADYVCSVTSVSCSPCLAFPTIGAWILWNFEPKWTILLFKLFLSSIGSQLERELKGYSGGGQGTFKTCGGPQFSKTASVLLWGRQFLLLSAFCSSLRRLNANRISPSMSAFWCCCCLDNRIGETPWAELLTFPGDTVPQQTPWSSGSHTLSLSASTVFPKHLGVALLGWVSTVRHSSWLWFPILVSVAKRSWFSSIKWSYWKHIY